MKHRSYKLSRNLRKSRTLVHQRRVNKKRMSKCPRRRQPVARRKKILLSKRLRLKRRNQDGRRRPTRRNQKRPKSRWNANFSSFFNLCNNYFILFQDPKEAADPYVFVSFVSGQQSADPPVPKERLLNAESTDEEIVPAVVNKRTYRRK